MDPHANLTEAQRKAGCPFTKAKNEIESRIDVRKMNKLNKIWGETASLDKFLRGFTYGMLLIKGLLLRAGLDGKYAWKGKKTFLPSFFFLVTQSGLTLQIIL